MDLFDKELQKLVAKGKSQGYLTYDEVNEYLPDEEVNPERLDNLLIAIDEQGIDLCEKPPLRTPAEPQNNAKSMYGDLNLGGPNDLADPPPTARRAAEIQQRPDPHVSQPNGRDSAACPRGRNFAGQDDRSHAEALPPHGARLQPGDERHDRHAHESASKAALPFDRTIKVSLTERLTKEQISARMPVNLHTLQHLMEENRKDFAKLLNRNTVGRRTGRVAEEIHPPPPQNAHAGRRAEPANAARARHDAAHRRYARPDGRHSPSAADDGR